MTQSMENNTRGSRNRKIPFKKIVARKWKYNNIWEKYFTNK